MACSKCGARRGHMGGCENAGGGKPAIDPGTDARTKRDLKRENSGNAREVVTGRALRAKQKANLAAAKAEEKAEREEEKRRREEQKRK